MGRDIGGIQEVTIRKMRAHTAQSAVVRGEIAATGRLGNEIADAQAKKGAFRHPVCPKTIAWRERACNALPRIAKFAVSVNQAVAPVDGGAERQLKRIRVKKAACKTTSVRHISVIAAERLRCI